MAIAQVAELVDALASGASSLYGSEGSSPFLGTSFVDFSKRKPIGYVWDTGLD